LERNCGLSSLRQVAHSALQFIHANGSSIEFDLVILINANDSVFKLRGLLFCRFGFWQINLNFSLVFLKSGRDDKKDQQNDENIDERNDDNDGRPSFSHCKLHGVKSAARLTLPA